MLSTAFARPLRAFCAVTAAAGLAVALTGCGRVAVLAPGHRLTIALMEYRLAPDRIFVPHGHLRITVENLGRLTHNLVISQPVPGSPAPGAPTSTVAGRAPDLPPGTRTTISVSLPPGRYTIASTVAGDGELDDQGTLTVGSG